MGLFDIFRKSKTELSDEQKKWNKMWDLWEENRTDTPYAELMTYQSEINNGGHDQYFLNVENTGDLQKEMAALETVLSEKLQKNLRDAYRAYQQLTDSESDEDTEAILEQCDDIFYQNEAEINCRKRLKIFSRHFLRSSQNEAVTAGHSPRFPD